jgi:F420-dependent oxidoreductase-like protein
MRIGLSGGASTVARMVDQAVEAEADGFTTLWYAGAIGYDPLATIAIAGRATTTLELGTAVLQTYPCHPLLQANRAAAVAAAVGREGFTLGIGPSHRPLVEGVYGLSFAHPGRHTEEYVTVLTALLRGETVDFDGEEFRVHGAALPGRPARAVPILVAALAPRLLRVAGALAEGTILWMANARAVETHVVPRIRAAAAAAGRPEPRIVAGLPVAVHDDAAEGRVAAVEQFSQYGTLPNYRRILDIGGAPGAADAAIVGDAKTVETAVRSLFDAGATDVWAAVFPVGADKRGSRERTRLVLKDLAARA